MKLPYIALGIGGIFLLVCLVAFYFTSRPDRQEEVPEEEPIAATSTTATPAPAVFSEEGRQASAPANALGVAPVCDQGVADREARIGGEISAYTKESVVQAILKRNELFRTASAPCIRTYYSTVGTQFEEGWPGITSMSDAQLVQQARYIAEIAKEFAPTDVLFRARMLSSEAEWTFEGSTIEVGFPEDEDGVSVDQVTILHNGAWY